MAAVCPGGSTVPAAVVIVVKHRACLSVGRFRRQISTESCHRVGSRAYQYGVLWVRVRRRIGMAAADTGSSFLYA